MSRQAVEASGKDPDIVFDGLEFARLGRQLEGRVPARRFERLADQLVDGSGEVVWHLRGEQDRDGNCFLVLQLSGFLQLRCQRCLEGVEEPLAVSSRLLLVPPGQAWPDDELADDGFDAVAATKEMALAPMIEDELLLALPIAPRHDVCDAPVAEDEVQELSPFAVLAKLKKGA